MKNQLLDLLQSFVIVILIVVGITACGAWVMVQVMYHHDQETKRDIAELKAKLFTPTPTPTATPLPTETPVPIYTTITWSYEDVMVKNMTAQVFSDTSYPEHYPFLADSDHLRKLPSPTKYRDAYFVGVGKWSERLEEYLLDVQTSIIVGNVGNSWFIHEPGEDVHGKLPDYNGHLRHEDIQVTITDPLKRVQVRIVTNETKK